jgi:hypothetical protein
MHLEEPRNYREIGRIVRLQIQRKTLKDPLAPRPGGARSPERYYDPAPILSGEMLWVADSVAAVPRGEEVILDIHAAAHPHSRNRGNGNMLSIGFTSHYDAMRDRFGDHLTNGIAGENILVETDEQFTVDDFQQGLAIVTQDTRALEFGEVIVAAPCVEFSRFCLDDRFADPRVTSDALRFLDDGMRGFYAYISSGLPLGITLGDTVAIQLA